MKLRSFLLAIVVLAVRITAHAQDASAASKPDVGTFIFESTISQIQQNKDEPNNASGFAAVNNLIPYAQFNATDQIKGTLLSEIEQSRIDQQVGPTGSTQNGSTNAVTKGSVPWLIGIAEEYGAMTQSTSGNTTTFKLNPINLIAAVSTGKPVNTSTYIQSYTAGNSAPMVSFLRYLSFGFSFNSGSQSSGVTSASSGQLSNSNSFTGFSAHYDIYNKRDPRNSKWKNAWNGILDDRGKKAASSLTTLDRILGERDFFDHLNQLKARLNQLEARLNQLTALKDQAKTAAEQAAVQAEQAAVQAEQAAVQQELESLAAQETSKKALQDQYRDWKTATIGAVEKEKDSDKPTIQKTLQDRAQALKAVIAANPTAQAAVDQAVQAVADYSSARNALIQQIMRSQIFSAEYNLVNQANQPIAKTGTNTTVMTAGAIPNLSNIKLIYTAPLWTSGDNVTQFTANFSTTLFNSVPPGAKTGTIRDYQLCGQLDIPTQIIAKTYSPTITFAGLFLSLLQQPLGQPVQVNGVNVNTKGNIGLFQAKLSVKVKNSGVEIPISFTYATRTELVKESDVRGNIGVTFNLDSLFASSASK